MISGKLLNVLFFLVSIFVIALVYYTINIGNTYLDERRKVKVDIKKILPVAGVFLGIIFYVLLSKRYPIISDTVGTIIVSIVIAYILNPLVNYLEKKGLNRKIGILLIYLMILAAIFILSFLVIPRTITEVKKLFNVLPGYINEWSKDIQNLYYKYIVSSGPLPEVLSGIQDAVMENIKRIQEIAFSSITGLFNGVVSVFSRVVSLVLIPILTFYFLNDKDHFLSIGTRMIPKKNREETIDLLKEIDSSLNLFVRGRLLLAVYVGVAVTILLLVLGVEFAVVIGFITGIADIVPYIGPFLGFLPAVFFAFLSSPMKGLWVCIIFVLIQWIENNVLAPKIIGDSTGIHPMTVLISLIIGGGMFGVIGMIFSVPFIVIVKILAKFIYGKLIEFGLLNK